MKFKVSQKKLLKILENTSKAIDNNSVFLPLRNFYIDVQENQIVICGSNGNFSVKHTLVQKTGVLEIEKLGSNLVSAALFINIIRKCSGDIEFEQVENNLVIKNNLDSYEINLIDKVDYPSIDFDLYGTEVDINAEQLRNAIKNVVFAASQKEEEIILNGVNLKLENKQLIITATNSYRLAREVINLNCQDNLFFDVTIHNKNIKDFIPQDINENVKIYVNEYKINLIHEDLIIQSKIIDVPYKDVGRVFQMQYNKSLTINKNVLANAIGKATVIVGDLYNKIRLEISQSQIVIISIKNEVGNSKVILKEDQFQYEGQPVIVTLNFKYLKEAISVFEEEIKLNLNNPESIILITSQSNPNNQQIVSPLRSY